MSLTTSPRHVYTITRCAPERVHAECDEAFLFIDTVVPDGDRQIVEQNGSGVGEANAVFLEIGGGFFTVPFDFHYLRLYVRTYIQSSGGRVFCQTSV